MAPEILNSLDKDELKPLVVALLEQDCALIARIAELEARLGQPPKTPDNSSLPPSHGQKVNRPAPDKVARKGRPGVARQLCPDPDHVRDIYAERCGSCGARADACEQLNVRAYDHIDLPPVKPVTTRINLHSGACRCCGARVAASPPADRPPGTPF